MDDPRQSRRESTIYTTGIGPRDPLTIYEWPLLEILLSGFKLLNNFWSCIWKGCWCDRRWVGCSWTCWRTRTHDPVHQVGQRPFQRTDRIQKFWKHINIFTLPSAVWMQYYGIFSKVKSKILIYTASLPCDKRIFYKRNHLSKSNI